MVWEIIHSSLKDREVLLEPPGQVRYEDELQGLSHSNSHGDGHADHGVVACAQETHHFHVKAAFGVFLPTAGRDEPCLFLK